jgi:hypothetical protein
MLLPERMDQVFLRAVIAALQGGQGIIRVTAQKTGGRGRPRDVVMRPDALSLGAMYPSVSYWPDSGMLTEPDNFAAPYKISNRYCLTTYKSTQYW